MELIDAQPTIYERTYYTRWYLVSTVFNWIICIAGLTSWMLTLTAYPFTGGLSNLFIWLFVRENLTISSTFV